MNMHLHLKYQYHAKRLLFNENDNFCCTLDIDQGEWKFVDLGSCVPEIHYS